MSSCVIAGGSKPEVNKEGIAYYNNLIDGLLMKGTPCDILCYADGCECESFSMWVMDLVVCRNYTIRDAVSLGPSTNNM